MPEPEYMEMFEEQVQEEIQNHHNFNEWLDEDYSASEIWNVSVAKHQEILQNWKSFCRDTVEEEYGFA